MTSYTTIRQAVSAEIKRLTNELSKLQKMLGDLDGSVPATAAPAGADSAGKRKYTRRQKPNDNDVQNAVKIIQDAGKGGIKAIKLAHEMKRAGGSKVGKAELLATEKVKMSGTGGGSTYTYVG